MRKITSLLMLLCMFVGTAWGQGTVQLKDYVSNPNQVFKLKNTATDLYMSVETPKAAEGIKIKESVDEDKQKFFLIATSSENYFFIQCASGEFIYKQSAWTAKTETQPTAFLVEEVETGVYRFYNKRNQAGYLGPNKNKQGNEEWSPLYSNHTNDNPNITWELELSTVTEDVLSNAIEKRKDIAVNPNDFPETQAFRLKNPNGHYMTLSARNTNGGITVTEKTDADTQKFFVFSSSENDGYFLQNTNTDGIKVVPGWHAQSNDSEASLFQIEQPEIHTFKFKSSLGYLGVNTNGSENGDGSKSGAVVYSNQTADNANIKWLFELVEVSGDLTGLFDKQNIYNTAYLNALLAAWKETTLAKLGYVGFFKKEAKESILALETYESAKSFDYDKVAMTSGYYFLKGTGNGNNESWYMTHKINKDTHNTEKKECLWADAPAGGLTAEYVWKFETAVGGYKMQCTNLNAYFNLTTATNAGDNNTYLTVAADDANILKLEDKGLAKFVIKDTGDNIIRSEDSGQLNYWSGEDNETWYIIPATELEITFGDAGYATTYLPFDVTLPNTVKAYAVNDIEGEYAKMEEKTDIPAKNAAILEGKGTQTLTIANATSVWTGNKLEGTFVNTYVGNGAYVLAMPTIDEVVQPVGFYKATLNKDENGGNGETHFLNSANKAYLPAIAVSSAARFLSFDFGNETAIESVEGAENAANAVIYDLSGRRVQKAQKGLYIVNGVKVIK